MRITSSNSPRRDAVVKPLLGMPRRRGDHGGLVVDGSQRGGVEIRYVDAIGCWETDEVSSADLDGAPCEDAEALYGLVVRFVARDNYDTCPDVFALRPLPQPDAIANRLAQISQAAMQLLHEAGPGERAAARTALDAARQAEADHWATLRRR